MFEFVIAAGDGPTVPDGGIGGASALIMIVVVSIGTDRVVALLLGLLSHVPMWAKYFPNPYAMEPGEAREKALKRVKTFYSFCAGLVGAGISIWGGVHLLESLGLSIESFGVGGTGNEPWLDCVITALVFMVGAEKSGQILKLAGVPMDEQKPTTPVDISGTFVVDPAAVQPAGAPTTDSTG